MSQYALRMDYDRTVDRGPLSNWLSANSARFLVVFETAEGENPHVHVILFSEKTLAALRASFKRAFEGKVGNGAYSLKLCSVDFEGYIRYMCKGVNAATGPHVEMRQGLEYTDDAIKAAHGMYWVNNDALLAARRARAVKMDVVEAIEKECKDKGVRSHDRVEIAKIYIRMKVTAKKGINVFQARSVVNTVSILLDDSGERETELAGEIARL